MKIFNFSKIILVNVILLAAFSCSDDDDKSLDKKVQENIKKGTWRITKFIDSNTDETNHFTGFNFTFGNGTLTATNGAITHSGIWSLTDSNSNDDSNDDVDFNLFFNLTNDFEDLNDDWDILSQTASKIELIDVSGGNGGTDLLTFEKN